MDSPHMLHEHRLDLELSVALVARELPLAVLSRKMQPTRAVIPILTEGEVFSL